MISKTANQCLVSTLAFFTLGFAALGFSSLGAQTLSLQNDLTHGDTVTVNAYGKSVNAYAGAIVGGVSGGAAQYFFCYDLTHELAALPASYSVDILSPAALSSSLLSYLSTSQTNISTAITLLNSLNLATLTSHELAGVQLATWTILADWTSSSQVSTLPNSSGNFYVTNANSSAIAAANSYLTTAKGIYSSGKFNLGDYKLFANTTMSNSQVLVGLPEPKTYLLLGACLALVILMKKRQVTNPSSLS